MLPSTDQFLATLPKTTTVTKGHHPLEQDQRTWTTSAMFASGWTYDMYST